MAEPIQLDVLAIFSHPDDAELTMAGTLLKLKSLGYRCGIADMTRRDGNPRHAGDSGEGSAGCCARDESGYPRQRRFTGRAPGVE